MNHAGSSILRGVGSYAPARKLDNLELSQRVETSDEWITTRTGIKERRIAGDSESTSDLAVEASRRAIADAGLRVEDVDLVIVATITPDMAFPSTACLLQHKLGIPKVACFDLEAACSGFLYALDVADGMLSSGRYQCALVVGAEKLSTIMDWEDRTTCVLFGDGAGAAVLAREGEGAEMLGFQCGADGSNPSLLQQPAGGSLLPASNETIESRGHYLKMNGREIFKSAVRVMERAALELLERHGIDKNEVSHVIPIRPMPGSLRVCPRDWKSPWRGFTATCISTGTLQPPRFLWPWTRPTSPRLSKRENLVCSLPLAQA